MKTVKNLIRTNLIIILVCGLFLSFFSIVVFGQSEISFSAFENFDIPINNGSISFAFDGTYEKASLEKGIWKFTNLQINNSQNYEKLDLKVSILDCNITISSYRVYNRTFGSEIVKRATLRYEVGGTGSQDFDFGLDPNMGDWGVKVNADYLAENRGWTLSPNGISIDTEVAANVILAYYGFPESFYKESFFNQHSIVIISSLIAAIVVIFSTVLKIVKNQKIDK